MATTTGSAVYVHGGELGLRRERRGGNWVILDSAGEPVTDPEVLDRIRPLRIPPAWTHVWIAGSPNAHLQATGLDSKGRRQYLYHPLWRLRRDHEKYDDMLEFAAKLPRIRTTTGACSALATASAIGRWLWLSDCSTSACSGSAGTVTLETTDMSA